MMKRTLTAGLLFALALTFGVTAHAQDEAKGSQSVIQAAIIPGIGFFCSPAQTNATTCYNIPMNVGGTLTIRAVPAAYVPYGYVFLYGVADLESAQYIKLTTMTYTSNAQHLLQTLHIEFDGNTADDGGTFHAAADFTFSYYQGASGGGKGGGGAGTKQLMQSGTITIIYN
jgi:hypothetical protein